MKTPKSESPLVELFVREKWGSPNLQRSWMTYALLFGSNDALVMGRAHTSVLRIDSKALADFYEECPVTHRLYVAASPAVLFSDPSTFQRIFQDSLSRAQSTSDMNMLLNRLAGYLRRNPSEAPKYQAVIQEGLRSRRRDVRAIGILLAGDHCSDLDKTDADRMGRYLKSAHVGIRLNGVQACRAWMTRWDQVGPTLRGFLLSDRTAAAMKDLGKSGNQDAPNNALKLAVKDFLRQRKALRD